MPAPTALEENKSHAGDAKPIAPLVDETPPLTEEQQKELSRRVDLPPVYDSSSDTSSSESEQAEAEAGTTVDEKVAHSSKPPLLDDKHSASEKRVKSKRISISDDECTSEDNEEPVHSTVKKGRHKSAQASENKNAEKTKDKLPEKPKGKALEKTDQSKDSKAAKRAELHDDIHKDSKAAKKHADLHDDMRGAHRSKEEKDKDADAAAKVKKKSTKSKGDELSKSKAAEPASTKKKKSKSSKLAKAHKRTEAEEESKDQRKRKEERNPKGNDRSAREMKRKGSQTSSRKGLVEGGARHERKRKGEESTKDEKTSECEDDSQDDKRRSKRIKAPKKSVNEDWLKDKQNRKSERTPKHETTSEDEDNSKDEQKRSGRRKLHKNIKEEDVSEDEKMRRHERNTKDNKTSKKTSEDDGDSGDGGDRKGRSKAHKNAKSEDEPKDKKRRKDGQDPKGGRTSKGGEPGSKDATMHADSKKGRSQATEETMRMLEEALSTKRMEATERSQVSTPVAAKADDPVGVPSSTAQAPVVSQAALAIASILQSNMQLDRGLESAHRTHSASQSRSTSRRTAGSARSRSASRGSLRSRGASLRREVALPRDQRVQNGEQPNVGANSTVVASRGGSCSPSHTEELFSGSDAEKTQDGLAKGNRKKRHTSRTGPPRKSLSRSRSALKQHEASPEKTAFANGDQGNGKAELEDEIESLKEMLEERHRARAEAHGTPQADEMRKEIETLEEMLADRGRELLSRYTSTRDLPDGNTQPSSGHEKQMLEIAKTKELLISQGGQKDVDRKDVSISSKVSPACQPPLEADADEVQTISGMTRQAPCGLPVWCAVPNADDVVIEVEIARIMTRNPGVARRLLFGRRSWVLFGRRIKEVVGTEQEPDIGLGDPRASRKHAVALRNWRGKIFVMDLGSPHRTFMDKKVLTPQVPVEWKIGSKVFFADSKVEVFELRPAKVQREAAPPPAKPSEPPPRNPSSGVPRHATPPPAAGPPTIFIKPVQSARPTGVHGEGSSLYPGEWDVQADGLTKFLGWKT